MLKKFCSICGKETYLFRSNPPTCKNCITKKPIKKVSDNKKELDVKYKKSKSEFIKEKLLLGINNCEVKSPVCTMSVDGIHHKKGKSTEDLYLAHNNFMLCCNPCNLYLEENPLWAYEKGFKIRRNSIS